LAAAEGPFRAGEEDAVDSEGIDDDDSPTPVDEGKRLVIQEDMREGIVSWPPLELDPG
jgi:hypothetical protein